MRIVGTTVTENRLLLAGGVVVVALVLGAVFRFTRFGLSTRAAAGNEKGALLLGISPDRLGAVNWIDRLDPRRRRGDPHRTHRRARPHHHHAARRPGARRRAARRARVVRDHHGRRARHRHGAVAHPRLRRAADTTWIPDWLPTTGLQQVVPVLLIIGALVWRGDALPDRSAVVDIRLPRSPSPRHVTSWTLGISSLVLVALFTVDAGYRQALIMSMVVHPAHPVGRGRHRLHRADLARPARVRRGRRVHRDPAHRAPRAAARSRCCWRRCVATVIGVLVGLPATRVRGMSLAIATLAMAVAIEELVLASPPLSGGGGRLLRPTTRAVRHRPRRRAPRGSDNFRPAFGFAVLVVARAELRRGRQPAAQPHRPALAGGAGQRAGGGRGRHRRDTRQARRVRRVVVPGRPLRRAHGPLDHDPLAHLVHGDRRARDASRSPTSPASRASAVRWSPARSPRPASSPPR